MQAEHHGIDRQCRAQLVEDFVAQTFIGLPVDETGGIGPGRRSLDQRPAFCRRHLAADRDRRRAKRRRGRMRAGRRIERGLEIAPVDADRRKRIGLGGKGGCEDAHEFEP
ncbi:hypothetical protein D3C87_1842310 [compost metagenome]